MVTLVTSAINTTDLVNEDLMARKNSLASIHFTGSANDCLKALGPI